MTEEQRKAHIESNRQAITWYFFKAWSEWEKAHTIPTWMERGFAFNHADTCLYQAIGLAGLRWPWSYKLPREKA